MIDISTFTGNSTPKDRLPIHMLAEDMGFTDIWRLVILMIDSILFFSHCHKTDSRIYLTLSNFKVNNVIDCKIGPIALTDHAIVELHVDINSENVKKGRFRLHTMLLQDWIFSQSLVDDLRSFF